MIQFSSKRKYGMISKRLYLKLLLTPNNDAAAVERHHKRDLQTKCHIAPIHGKWTTLIYGSSFSAPVWFPKVLYKGF